VLGGLVLLSLVLITASFRNSHALASAEGVGASALKPFQVAAERVAQPFRDTYGYFAGLAHAKSENEKLKREVQQLRLKNVASESALQDVVQLKALLHYEELPQFPVDFRPVNTRVISFPQGPFDQEIEIAAGTSSGVAAHTPVVTAAGLVGEVTKAGPDTASVTLLTDAESFVSAVDEDTGATGIIERGQSGDGTLILDRVQPSKVVNAGDVIVTAGTRSRQYPSLYPRNIPIGVVTSASNSSIAVFKQIQVQPYVDFSSLDSVAALVRKR
jgi:rod shape-determining protein MreC